MTAPVFANGQTVTLITRTKTGEDSYGNDVYGETPTDVPGCVVWPTASTENVQAEDQVITGLTALLPVGTDVSAIDAVIVAGLRYEVVGDPSSFSSPFSNLNPGIEIRLSKVTG